MSANSFTSQSFIAFRTAPSCPRWSPLTTMTTRQQPAFCHRWLRWPATPRLKASCSRYVFYTASMWFFLPPNSNASLFFIAVPAAVLQALRRRQPRAVDGCLSRRRRHVNEHGVSAQRHGPRVPKVSEILFSTCISIFINRVRNRKR